MFPVFENLRAFFNSRPPLVVFMICLASFAIALITFAYIVKTKDIPDSDVIEDWNTFLEKFSKIDLCFSQNASENVLVNSTGGKLSTGRLSPSEIYQTLQDKFKEIDVKQALQFHKINRREVHSSATPQRLSEKVHHVTDTHSKDLPSVTAKPSPTSMSSDTSYMNVSFVLNVEVFLSKDKVPHLPWAETHFITIITGDMLKLRGDLTNAEMVVTFAFPNNLSSSTCQTWDKGVCSKHVILACVQLRGPRSMFPNTPMPELSEICHVHHNAGESPSLHFMVPSLPGTRSNKEMCRQGSHMSTYFSFDESLTVLLSLHDRSVINLRLMRTSYFLFVMVVTFLCYAMIKGKRSKNKANHIPYVEKIPA